MSELTDRAYEALTEVALQLGERDEESMTPLEWRTYLWARASLAVLCGIRVDGVLAEGVTC